MIIGRNPLTRTLVIILISLFAVTQVAGAQEFAEYESPENIEDLTGEVVADGSSTVGPLTAAAAEEFLAIAPNVSVVVDISGTGGGFERFCAGETDLSNASRAIAPEEIAMCEENGVEFYEFRTALDALTVVVNAENEFVDCLTVEQLQQLWAPDSQVETWSDLNPEWPDEAITLYGPGADSGTFDYFTEVIVGEEGASRTDYQPSEDDNVIVQGVANDQYALGYFGLAYYLENQDALKAVEIDSGEGCVAPSAETASSGEYAPLSRPLYLYVRDSSLELPAVQEFLQFYLANAQQLAEDVGYVAMSDELLAEQQQQLEGAIEGSVAPYGQDGAATPEATPAA